MREPITTDDVDQLESAAAAEDEGGRRNRAEQLIAWAQEPHPQDEVSPRELLTRAGEHVEFAGTDDAAAALYRRAAAADGAASLDPRSHLLALLLRHGDQSEAEQLDRELRRSTPAESVVYEYTGSIWEEFGDPRRALGWYTRGVLRHEQGAGLPADDLGRLCVVRWRLRERAGHQPDDYDLIGIGWAGSALRPVPGATSAEPDRAGPSTSASADHSDHSDQPICLA